jgi:hypothetical protein
MTGPLTTPWLRNSSRPPRRRVTLVTLQTRPCSPPSARRTPHWPPGAAATLHPDFTEHGTLRAWKEAIGQD